MTNTADMLVMSMGMNIRSTNTDMITLMLGMYMMSTVATMLRGIKLRDIPSMTTGTHTRRKGMDTTTVHMSIRNTIMSTVCLIDIT